MKYKNLLPTCFLFLSFVVSTMASTSAEAKRKPVETAVSVDLNAYLGLWYEYAVIPHFFERKCVSGTQAEYGRTPENLVSVRNTCITKDGEKLEAVGIAKVVDPVSGAKLKVTFAHAFGKWIYVPGGNYWILDVGPQSSYALVGSPNRSYAWILSRTPQLDTAIVKTLAEKLKEQGYDPCKLVLTPQEGGNKSKASLCTVLN